MTHPPKRRNSTVKDDIFGKEKERGSSGTIDGLTVQRDLLDSETHGFERGGLWKFSLDLAGPAYAFEPDGTG